MADAVEIDVGFNGLPAFRGLEQLRSLLGKTKTSAERETSSIRRSLESIGDTRVRSSLLDGLDSQLGRSRTGIQGAVSGITSSLGSISPALSGITSAIPGMGLLAAATVGVAAGIGAIGKAALDAAAKVEGWKANLLTITGSSQKAEDSYAALVKFASNTPFDLNQSVEGFIKLRTLGLQATEKALTSFGNTAAAMGKPLNQMIEAVADAATGEFERLKEFGIKSKVQGDKVKFTFGGVATSVENNAASIQKYLEDLGNTKFGGAMARQMDTINGAMSNVEDATFQALAAIGGGQLGDAFKGILKTIAAGIGAITPVLGSLGNFIGSIVGTVGKILNSFTSLWSNVNTGGAGVTPILDNLATVFNLLAKGVSFFGDAIASAFSGISGFVSSARNSIADYLGITQQASKNTASWGDLANAAWEQIGSAAATARTSIMSALSDMVSGTKSVFSDIGSYLSSAFSGPIEGIKSAWSGISGYFSDLFEGLDFSPAGIVQGAARIVDQLVGTFRGGVAAIRVLFDGLPGAIYASLSPGFQTIVSGAKTLFVGIANAIAAVYNAIVGFGKSVASNIASVFNAVGSFIEKWVNKAVGGINTIISAANKLGAGIATVAQVKIGQVQAPKAGAGEKSAFSKLGADMGAAFKGGFGHEAETIAKGVIARANALSKKRGSGSGGLDSGTVVTPKADPKKEKGGKKGGKSDAEKAAEEAAKKAAEATKKYEDAVASLNSRIADLTLTQEQKALADELERAGLSRDVKQVNEKANAIRALFKTLRDGESVKKVNEVMADFNKSVRELGYSAEQLAQVEARRRAGLPEDLSITTDLTRKIDAQAASFYRLQKAKENANAVKEIEKTQTERGQDLAIDRSANSNPDKAEDDRAILRIERERAANVEKIRALEGISAAKKAELVANENNLAVQEQQAVVMARQTETANQLTSFLTNLWDNPREAMKQFFKDMLKRIIEATLKAAILGEKLGGAGGFGGLIKSAIGGALGGRATGGSVRAGDVRMVGERGPELVKFGAAGQVFNARKTRGMTGGTSVSMGETHIHIQGGVSNDSMAQLRAQQAAYERTLMAKIDNRIKQTR